MERLPTFHPALFHFQFVTSTVGAAGFRAFDAVIETAFKN